MRILTRIILGIVLVLGARTVREVWHTPERTWVEYLLLLPLLGIMAVNIFLLVAS